jgi:signal transduction histidine kinase
VLRDVAVAAAVAGVLALIASAEMAGGRGGAVAYLSAAALGVLMFWRRRFARTVLVLTVFGLFAYYSAGLAPIGLAVPVAAALYAAAEAGHRRLAVGAALLALGVSIPFRLDEGEDFGYVVIYDGIGQLALMAAAITLGELVRARRRIATLTGRQIELESERRIHEHNQELSRELHDSIGHALTVAAIQANVARQEAPRDATATVAALDHVSEALSDALAELRGTVRNLRAGPSLSDLDALMDTARAAGFQVRAEIGPVADGPVAATAYRLVREAVTNVLRHSAGRTIDVEIRESDGLLLVTVEDDGVPAASGTSGAGLTGLHERVSSLGGRLDAGPGGNGWRVSAALPVEAAR